jgi:hypothetical protein
MPPTGYTLGNWKFVPVNVASPAVEVLVGEVPDEHPPSPHAERSTISAIVACGKELGSRNVNIAAYPRR